MNSTLGSIIGLALCALLMTACGGTDAIPGFGGGTICASDDPDAGDVYQCPDGEKTFDFCINTSSGSCYYVVDGQQLDCGNCLESGAIPACAQQAAEACN